MRTSALDPRMPDVPQLVMGMIAISSEAGLLGRAPGVCHWKAKVWPGNDKNVLARAASKRDRHERRVHHYVHQPLS